MTANTRLLAIRADSFVHVGEGQGFGEVDLPFVREPATGYPYLPGSGLKGALRRNWWQEHPAFDPPDKPVAGADEKRIFGDSDSVAGTAAAGTLIVGDGRLAFLPVRSLGRGLRYLTCPLLLQRCLRDFARCGITVTSCDPYGPFRDGDDKPFKGGEEKAVSHDGEAPLFLEEFRFDEVEEIQNGLRKAIEELLEHLTSESEAQRLVAQTVIVTDENFDHFAGHALPVRMRNKLDEDKVVERGMLWSEEYLPPETLLYAVLARRALVTTQPDPLAEIESMLEARGNYIQIGGNETVGQGLVALHLRPDPAAPSPPPPSPPPPSPADTADAGS